jgi:hypothetical protein
MKMPAPTRPITAVTISNIANILCAPHEQNDVQARTVKRISWWRRAIADHWGFGATGVPKPSSEGCDRDAKATINSPSRHLRKTHPISAVFSLRYLQLLDAEVGLHQRQVAGNCLEVGGCPAEW